VGAALVGGFLAFVSAFNTGRLPFVNRAVYMVGMSLVGALLGVGAFRLVWLIPATRPYRWLQALVGGVLLSFPMTIAAWAMQWMIPGEGDPIRMLPHYYPTTLVISVVMTLVAVGLHRQAARTQPIYVQAPAAPAPPRFLERLPPKLRGAEIWAVEAEDHYLRLHTSKGQDLILMRLADAIDELEGIEGARTHRSWWVARDAIADAKRADGRAVLTLKDGAEIPVSRTYAKVLREAGWI